jgi:putative phosphoribosyl transferase
VFTDRVDAGRQLAARLDYLRDQQAVVLGLPRGGVPVAAEVARALGAPLDVIVVRKLGVPFQPELAMGAIGEDGVLVIDAEVMRLTGLSDADLAPVEEREQAEVARRARRYRGDRRRARLDGRTAVVVDDGIATGSTAVAACRIARALGAARIVLAVPVAPKGWEDRIGAEADDLVSVSAPTGFLAIGQFYADFAQSSDAEVAACLASLAQPSDTRPPDAESSDTNRSDTQPSDTQPSDTQPSLTEVEIQAGSARLSGLLAIPPGRAGIVLFAHGSGSSRHSPRNGFVAAVLQEAGLATLLLDLLTVDEEADRANVFNVAVLAERLAAATAWVRGQDAVANLPVGYFGASTGAAAALLAAAEPGADIAAVVSRGGRPDLARPQLDAVRAPTLLIVGGDDEVVLDLNRLAQTELTSESELAVVAGATHLFEEPGTLEQAAELARDWFVRHFGV